MFLRLRRWYFRRVMMKRLTGAGISVVDAETLVTYVLDSEPIRTVSGVTIEDALEMLQYAAVREEHRRTDQL